MGGEGLVDVSICFLFCVIKGFSGGAGRKFEDSSGDGEPEPEGEGVRDGNGEPNRSTFFHMPLETLCSKSKVTSTE